uniref:PRD domain-containing protein n=1 Tax=Candidatus Enterococcus willemsii TaxID=1857215 RepID=UPI00403FB0C3
MKIRQILNNNVAIVKRGGIEIIVISKGLSFKYKVGQMMNEADIEKSYILDSYDKLQHFSYLLSQSDPDDIFLIDTIISTAEAELGIQASDYLSLTLLDHLEFLLERAEKDQFIQSPLIWDVKRFYPEYFAVGLMAIQKISEAKQLELPEDEAVSIALHFVNMQATTHAQEKSTAQMRALADMVSIIELHFKIHLDEESTNYMRFITHIQYFIERIINHEIIADETDSIVLYQQVGKLYPEAFKVVQKLKIYINNQFQVDMSISEETYLMLHVNRLTKRLEEN